jgi:hypothetical protein
MTAAVAIGASYGPASGSLIELEAANHMGMRWFCNPCDPIPLNFMAIRWGDVKNNRGFEDRTFLVYDLSSFTDPDNIKAAHLNLGIRNQDSGGPSGVIDISSDWLENDSLPPEAFWWGDLLQAFPADDPGRIYEVEVTKFIRDGVNRKGPPFAFFRLSTESLDRYFVGPGVGFPVPTLTVTVPEPSGISCIYVAGGFFILKRPRGRSIKSVA